ncbi:hypothetical protein [Pontibacillus yanchengensis]|uniref:Uncharacterized protein n=1 Tax=Pontibacillus yanchengensis Y32 TaxID=1385514 RepID=A0A0A2TZJ2_9BACI|nr:hypothetical protein [Pontibacillus yanchengensis]KGP74685.1 hypothetical protein N782_00495 [Pontibacillus yanchengensis Y32]
MILLQRNFLPGLEKIIVGLLSLLATAFFGLTYSKNRPTNELNKGTIIAIGGLIFLVTFVLTDNSLVGFEIMFTFSLSFLGVAVLYFIN